MCLFIAMIVVLILGLFVCFLQPNPIKSHSFGGATLFIYIRYEGRYDVLDANLRRKYGAGFIPTIGVNPQLSTSTSKLLSSMKDQKAKIAQKMESAAQRQKNRGDGDQKKPDDSYHVSDIGVAVEVKASEVIPIICGRSSSKDLKFILVDCRPEMSQNEGRFATSVSASSLTDVDKLETLEALFEKLRGAVHIVVMGEGFSAFPELYHHQLSRNESHLAREDHARTQNCAHFFIKRGYPFVSILGEELLCCRRFVDFSAFPLRKFSQC